MEKQNSSTGNLILFPFMAQGHMNPFLDLARHLARIAPSLTITIVSTPANILNLRPRFLSYPSIHFTSLSFNLSDDPSLPPNTENTDSLSSLSSISHFYHTSESLLQPSFHRLITQITQSNAGRPPICVISDMFLGFTVDIAHSLGSRHVPLYTSGPYAMSIYNSIWTHLPHLLTCADVLTLPDLPPHITIHRSQLSKNMISVNPSTPSFAKRQAEMCKRSDGSLWNTVQVLEKETLDHWRESSGRPVWAIGPLLPNSSQEYERGGKQPDVSPIVCVDWLNLHPPRSVLYVSFGSQNSVPPPQMMELAKGLEESGCPFIWVLRNPTGLDVGEPFRPEWLPDGFEKRIKERKQGLLVRNWGPQMEILSHRSTGAFLSHCGWNSVLESLSRGVPIIAWPLGSEQFYNSKLLEEELGVCVEIARGFDAVIDGSDLSMKVKLVLEGEKGEEMRRKAEFLGEEMKTSVSEVDGVKGLSLRALDDFVKTLMRWAKEQEQTGTMSEQGQPENC